MSRKLSTEFTRPRHASLAVVLQVRDGSLQVLLWARGRDPFRGAWALPGGLLELPEAFAEDDDSDHGEFDPDEDPLLDRAIEIVVQAQTASTSLLQRRLRVGYTRAGRLIDMLERRGIISGYEGSKPRRVLIDEAMLAPSAVRD
jgi:DNA segregation ATPase FtsK/SpoIIIE-like protein